MLGGALDELLGDCRLLCFDEFHVHDIGDAMLITRLFRAVPQEDHPGLHLQLRAAATAAQSALPRTLPAGDPVDRDAHGSAGK